MYKRLIKFIRPFVRHIALHCGLKLNYPHMALGEHPLIFDDPEDIYIKNVPASVLFNTRSGKIVIGRNTVFGEDVMLLTGKHNYISEISNLKDLQQVPSHGRDIIIGQGCYVGSGAIIIGPVNIGDYSVIGAGAVVTKNVESKSLYAGIPAKKIKELKAAYES